MTKEFRHVPVMLTEVLDYLKPQAGEVVCDCTLGGAGHTLELAKHVQPGGLSIGIDQDDMALEAAAKKMDAELPAAEHLFLKGNFGQLDELLLKAEVPGVDMFLFDIGVSSAQLDIPERGFSYREDAPLDMRMDPSTNTLTAAEVINTQNEADLAWIFSAYGDEKFAKSIAKGIVKARAKAEIKTTFELVEIIKNQIPAPARRKNAHPARKVFQALRIYVNKELEVLEKGLDAAIRWANPGGRICVISYHSLEDKIVKHKFQELSQGCICPPDFPVCVCGHVPYLKVETRKPLVARPEEVEINPRSRSALMRVATKL